LMADDFCGFWSKKAGMPDSTLLDTVIKSAPKPSQYPSYNDRISSAYDGWQDGSKPFMLPPFSSLEHNSASKYRENLDFLVTVTPENYKRRFKTYTGNRVTIHLVSSNRSLQIDTAVKEIDHILYVFNEKAFADPYQPSVNVNSDYFGYSLTRVTEKFPMVCIIFFKDGSAISVIKDLHLDNIKLS
jgi:hypothetical protein